MTGCNFCIKAVSGWPDHALIEDGASSLVAPLNPAIRINLIGHFNLAIFSLDSRSTFHESRIRKAWPVGSKEKPECQYEFFHHQIPVLLCCASEAIRRR